MYEARFSSYHSSTPAYKWTETFKPIKSTQRKIYQSAATCTAHATTNG
jgi:hypothetical protein